MSKKIRNIAIVAHVDHGKTTLVDKLLQQSGTLNRKDINKERIMDSNEQEKERGITILAKNTAINWKDYHINIVDTPGHADFGGEVERVLSMVDSVLLLVDAVDGPMPQTRFVTQKAFEQGLNPIVVINKIDRPSARANWVIDEVFDLFDRLGANDDQLDFPIVYASALQGSAGSDIDNMSNNMDELFEMITTHVPAPKVDQNKPFQMQISALDYSSFLGIIGVGRISSGSISPGSAIKIIDTKGAIKKAKILKVMGHLGLDRVDVNSATAGDIICISGVDKLEISDTLCDPDNVLALPPLIVDEPTVSMTFQVNDSPFAGQDGKYVTSRNIKDRLEKELLYNVALRVEQLSDSDKFKVSGRGELHISVLIESMRREGFEMAISRPEVVTKEENSILKEPFEQVVIDIEQGHQGAIMEAMGARQAELKNMIPDNKGRVRLDFIVPAKGLIGFRSQFLTMTSGSGILTNIFDHYGEIKSNEVSHRTNGVLVSMVQGKILGYALWNLQERGRLCVQPNINVYEGQVIGIHNRDNDLVVNPTKAKQLTNIRASGSDENIQLTPPINFSLEQALEFIDTDELVEVTPHHIRIRKKFLKESDRKREQKK